MRRTKRSTEVAGSSFLTMENHSSRLGHHRRSPTDFDSSCDFILWDSTPHDLRLRSSDTWRDCDCDVHTATLDWNCRRGVGWRPIVDRTREKSWPILVRYGIANRSANCNSSLDLAESVVCSVACSRSAHATGPLLIRGHNVSMVRAISFCSCRDPHLSAVVALDMICSASIVLLGVSPLQCGEQ